MKKILITGANSYIGVGLENWLNKWPEKYYIETIDMQDNSWENYNFSEYDTIYHVAGIAHIKEKKDKVHLYYEVNEELAVATAQKAKK